MTVGDGPRPRSAPAGPMNAPAAPVRALIFDFDGLIVDTEMPIFDSWQQVYRDHGEELDVVTYLRCVGSTFGQFDPMSHLDDRLGRGLPWEEINPARESRVRRSLEGADTIAGVRELLHEARLLSVPVAVGSSSSSHWVEGWLEQLELRSFFHSVRCRDHVGGVVKPEPDLFLAAAEAMGAEPEHTVVFEDSANGLEAARRAGMRCVVVPNGVTRHAEFSGATHVLERIDDFNLQAAAEAGGPAAR